MDQKNSSLALKSNGASLLCCSKMNSYQCTFQFTLSCLCHILVLLHLLCQFSVAKNTQDLVVGHRSGLMGIKYPNLWRISSLSFFWIMTWSFLCQNLWLSKWQMKPMATERRQNYFPLGLVVSSFNRSWWTTVQLAVADLIQHRKREQKTMQPITSGVQPQC